MQFRVMSRNPVSGPWGSPNVNGELATGTSSESVLGARSCFDRSDDVSEIVHLFFAKIDCALIGRAKYGKCV